MAQLSIKKTSKLKEGHRILVSTDGKDIQDSGLTIEEFAYVQRQLKLEKKTIFLPQSKYHTIIQLIPERKTTFLMLEACRVAGNSLLVT